MDMIQVTNQSDVYPENDYPSLDDPLGNGTSSFMPFLA